MKADAKTSQEIEDVLKRYAQGYAKKDVGTLMEIMAPDEDLIFIGTGKDEWVQGSTELKKGFERDLSQAESIKVDFGDLPISAAGNVAWTSTMMTMHAEINGEILVLEGRLSVVFEKRENKWLIVQLHFSIPATEQEEGQSFPQE